MSHYSELKPEESVVLEKFEGYKFIEMGEELRELNLPEDTIKTIVRSAIGKAIACVNERKQNPKIEMDYAGIAKSVFVESVAPFLPNEGEIRDSFQTRISRILAGIAVAVQVCMEPLQKPVPQKFTSSRRTTPVTGKARKNNNKRTV